MECAIKRKCWASSVTVRSATNPQSYCRQTRQPGTYPAQHGKTLVWLSHLNCDVQMRYYCDSPPRWVWRHWAAFGDIDRMLILWTVRRHAALAVHWRSFCYHSAVYVTETNNQQNAIVKQKRHSPQKVRFKKRKLKRKLNPLTLEPPRWVNLPFLTFDLW